MQTGMLLGAAGGEFVVVVSLVLETNLLSDSRGFLFVSFASVSSSWCLSLLPPEFVTCMVSCPSSCFLFPVSCFLYAEYVVVKFKSLSSPDGMGSVVDLRRGSK